MNPGLLRCIWSAAMCFSAPSLCVALAGPAPDGVDIAQCAKEKVAFDGIEPLHYVTVTGESSNHIALNREHPAICAKAKDPVACEGKAYLVPGDVVAVANTCGEFAHVQFIGEKKVSYG